MNAEALVDAFESEVIEATPVVVPLSDMRAAWELAETEPPSVFERGILPHEELAVLASEPGAGKSYLTLMLALSIAFYKILVSGFVPKRRGKVLLYFGEDGRHPVSRRIRAICERHGISEDEYLAALDDGRLQFVCGDSSNLFRFQGGEALPAPAYIELAERCKTNKYDLVVIDSFAVWVSPSDENSSGEVNPAAEKLVSLAKITGGSVLALHHLAKRSSQTKDYSISALRGSGALGGRVRWCAIMAPLAPGEATLYAIPEDRIGHYVTFRVPKNSNAEPWGAPYVFERMEGGVLERVVLAKPTPADSLAPLARAVADKIGANRANRTKRDILRDADFRAELKVEHKNATTDRVRAAYLLAVENGWLIEDSDEDASGDAPKIPRIPSFEVAA